MNLGIITEYNPLHNGHIFHLEESKKISNRQYTVAVMSGDFVQRGETSFLNKYIRTKMALLSGVDIVLMLPVVFSSQSSERFAYGSIKTLEATGIVDCFSFGSEIGDINILKKYAEFLNNPTKEYREKLKNNLKLGYSYPKARELSLESIFPNNILNNPNNILGIDYLRFNQKLKPYTITRKGESYHSKNVNQLFPSASGIRESIKKTGEIPKMAMAPFIEKIILENKDNFSEYNKLSNIFHYILISTPMDELLKIVDLNQELLNRLIYVSKTHFLLSDIAHNVKCKNYTFTRIKRVINNIILNITNTHAKIEYIRVLGFKKESSFLISELTKKASVPVIINSKDYKNLNEKGIQMYKKDLFAWDIYNLTTNYNYKSDLEISIIKI